MYTFLGLPICIIIILNLVGKFLNARLYVAMGIFVSIMQVAASVISFILLMQYHKEAVYFSQFWDMTVSENAAFLSVDIMSLIALLCIGLVSIASFATAISMGEEKVFHYTNIMMVIMLGMNGIVMVTDLFSMYVFLEITAVASFLLVSLHRDKLGMEGAFKYFVTSAVATVLILCSFAFLFMEVGSLNFEAIKQMFHEGQITNPPLIFVALVFFISGFSIKSGIFPFHGWLPDATQSAPASVSVLLCGVVTKITGIYALLRLLDDLIADTLPAANVACLMLGLISITVGAICAMGQNDLRRILAYSEISQMGYLLLGISCGNAVGIVGTLMHFFTQVIATSTLYVNAAAIEQRTGITDISLLGNLQRKMPVTATTCVVSFLSASGLPPFGGFWSKLIIIIAVWQANGSAIGIIALCTCILTCGYFLRMYRNIFWGQEKENSAAVTEAGKGIVSISVMLSAIIVLAGILMPLLLKVLQAQGLL